jgi:predicted transcriptional regulator
LVETLAAFIEGLEDTEGESKRMFRTFLTTRNQFKADFTTDDIADKIYKQFRSGILHQAETGGSSKVWSVGPMLSINGDAITVNRNKFHECLKGEFQSYLTELRDPKNAPMRSNFRKNMNFVSRL